MRVLLVEDEVNIAGPLKRALTNEGFVVDVAYDGITGQWSATENPYDVIVLDIMLPGRNGYDVLRNLRGLKVWTPVLMLTAKDGEYDQTDAFDLGADDYLSKPFSFMSWWQGCVPWCVVARRNVRSSWTPATSGWTRPCTWSPVPVPPCP
jgi:DNA-binding response OmpR family regulator